MSQERISVQRGKLFSRLFVATVLCLVLSVVLATSAWADESSDSETVVSNGVAANQCDEQRSATASQVPSQVSSDVDTTGASQTAEEVRLAVEDDDMTASSNSPVLSDEASMSNAKSTVDSTVGDVTDTQLASSSKVAVQSTPAQSDSESSGTTNSTADDYASTHTDIYRIYNPNSGEHFYTSSFYEATAITKVGWRYEGVGWVAPTSGDAVYRLYNPNAGDHHYTLSSYERDFLTGVGWRFEGISWYSDSSDQCPVYRAYNPNATAGAHHFTVSSAEYYYLGSVGWSLEGVAYFASKGDVIPIQGEWVKSSSWGSEHLYWIDSTGTLASSRWVTTTEGSPYCAYVGPDGAAQTGTFSVDGISYLASDTGVAAPLVSTTVSGTQGASIQNITPSAAGETEYLFFPSYSDMSQVTVTARLVDGTNPSGITLSSGRVVLLDTGVSSSSTVDLSSFDSLVSDGRLSLVLDYGALARYSMCFMQSANVSTVYINSADVAEHGRTYVEGSADHSAKADVAVTVVNAKGESVYDKDKISTGKTSTIKGRGNSTWGIGNKKPYQISLNKKADLLETGKNENKNKKWILLANANDATLLHNTVAYDLGLELGLSGIEGTPVDLYYDGDYRGSYYLCEKVEIKSGRVDISDLEGAIEDANDDFDFDSVVLDQVKDASGNVLYQYVRADKDGNVLGNPADITGGYLLELDCAYYRTEPCWFKVKTNTGRELTFVVKSPEVCSKECMQDIREYVQTAITNMERGEFNSSSSVSFDLSSLAKTYLTSEFLKNIDAFNTSTYFYKDAGNCALVAAPLWDFDGSCGTRTDWGNNLFRKYEDLTLVNSDWVINNEKVRAEVRHLYDSAFKSLVHDVILGDKDAKGEKGYLHSIAYYRNQIERSERMDEALYGLTAFGNTFKPFSSYDLNVRYLFYWLQLREQWWTENEEKLTSGDVSNPTSVYEGVDYSDVYDYSYYIKHNPDVLVAFGGDAIKTLEHFVTYGMDEGRQGCAGFNVQAYKDKYVDLRNAFGNNTKQYYLHFIVYGFSEGRMIPEWSTLLSA